MNALPLVGDCRSIPLPDGSVDAVVTDPPYGLAFMGKAWDHDVPGPDYWREVYRVMKPGAHLLAFGGTRTWHWLTVGIEEAGFEIRDCLSWMYGTGFPKSHDISKAIDKAAGAEREVVGPNRWDGLHGTENTNTYGEASRAPETAPATEQAERWDGFGTALKPAWEPIVLAMKPTDGTFAENALTHGVAGLNVDGCRISHDEECRMLPDQHGDEPGDFYQQGGRHGETMELKPDGRWPANVTLSHSHFCIEPEDEDGEWTCPPSCPVRQLDEQSGHLPGPANKNPSPKQGVTGVTEFTSGGEDRLDYIVDRDGGGASRFYYCAKASRSEREAGLDGFKEKKAGNSQTHEDGTGDTRMGRTAEEGERPTPTRANHHPTVKPIDLCRWLVRLVTRKGHLVLDPFMGSGSIGCAALQERRRYIGLDLEPEYVEIARARLEHWAPKQVDLFKDAEA